MWIRVWKPQLAFALSIFGVALVGPPALAQSGSAAHPIIVHMKRGADRIRLQGVLLQGVDCCAYIFRAEDGQRLSVKETGAVVRLTLTYPDGHTDGPGLPEGLLLPGRGTYVLAVSPDTMADGAFGKFTLTLTIPPVGITPGTSVNGDRP